MSVRDSRLRHDVPDANQHLTAMLVADFSTKLQLTNNDSWMNAKQICELCNLCFGVHRPDSGDKVFDAVLWDEKVAGKVVSNSLDRRLFFASLSVIANEAAVNAHVVFDDMPKFVRKRIPERINSPMSH